MILNPEADAGPKHPGHVLYIYDMEHVPEVQVASRAGGEPGLIDCFGCGHGATFLLICLILHRLGGATLGPFLRSEDGLGRADLP